MQVSIEQSSWSGPLPAPSDMAMYGEIVANGAERIFAAWEEESRHRRELEKQELRWAVFEAILGKTYAIIFVLAALSLAPMRSVRVRNGWRRFLEPASSDRSYGRS
ncbi:DUF2335 domain-containing protein [Brucella sp. IR073]|uniref:DUF2335 domain-containing protein n=1 Tax=unclassified Brucella TaxID=2632610 RepID=UPI003B97D45E